MRSATSEQAVHRTVCQHLRQRGAAGLVWWHTPNGGHRSPVEAAIFMSKQTNVALRHRTAQGFKP